MYSSNLYTSHLKFILLTWYWYKPIYCESDFHLRCLIQKIETAILENVYISTIDSSNLYTSQQIKTLINFLTSPYEILICSTSVVGHEGISAGAWLAPALSFPGLTS